MLNKSLLAMLISSVSLTAAEPDWLASFTLPGEAGALAHFNFEKESVRITAKQGLASLIPALRGPNLHTVNSSVAVGGDFEWIADYTVHAFGTPASPPTQEANAQFALQCRGHHGMYGFNVGFRKDRGPCFNCYHGHPHAGGYHFNMMTFSRTSDSGRLCLRRQGAELVFLAADGPGAALSELVRIPIRADLLPHLGFSAYQGNGDAPPDVDVSFTNMAFRADRIVSGAEAQAVAAPLEGAKPYGVNLDYTNKAPRLMIDYKASSHSSAAFQLDGDALRIHPPVKPAYNKNDNSYFFRESQYGLEGDFEVSWRYRMAAVGPFGKEGSGTASFSVHLRSDAPVGSYNFSVGGARDTSHRYGVTQEVPTKKGLHYNTQNFRTAAAEGRMIIRRIGAELSFLVQEPQDAAPRLLSRMPYMADRIPKVRIAAYQGANGTNILDGTIRDLVVKAERLVTPDTGEAVGALPTAAGDTAVTAGDAITLDTLPQNKSNKWWYVKVAVMALGGVLLVTGAVLVVRSRGGR